MLAEKVYDLVHEELQRAGVEDGEELHILGVAALEMASSHLRFSLDTPIIFWNVN